MLRNRSHRRSRPRANAHGVLTTTVLPLLAAGALAAAGVPAARAEVLSLDIDPTASRIEFGFDATFHSVGGTLQLQGGSIRFDTATGAAAGEVAAAAATAQTGVRRRDRKMHEKILESAAFPTIVVSIERIDGALNRNGRSELQLHGTLTLHGVSRPVAIPVVAKVEGDHVDATGFLSVDYMNYGMRDPSFLLLRVEKEVKVKLTIAGRLSPAESVVTARAAGSSDRHRR